MKFHPRWAVSIPLRWKTTGCTRVRGPLLGYPSWWISVVSHRFACWTLSAECSQFEFGFRGSTEASTRGGAATSSHRFQPSHVFRSLASSGWPSHFQRLGEISLPWRAALGSIDSRQPLFPVGNHSNPEKRTLRFPYLRISPAPAVSTLPRAVGVIQSPDETSAEPIKPVQHYLIPEKNKPLQAQITL